MELPGSGRWLEFEIEVVVVGFIEKVISTQNLEEAQGVNHADVWCKAFQVEGTASAKAIMRVHAQDFQGTAMRPM